VLETRPDLDDATLAKLPRHVVTRALGMMDALRVAVRTFEISPGDKYVLCSDGLTDVLGSDQIVASLNLAKTPEEEVSLLIEMAKDAGSRDNIAVVVIACDGLPQGRLLTPLPRPAASRHKSIPPSPSIDDDDAPEIVILSEGHADVVPAPPPKSGLEKDLEPLVGPPRPAPRKT
jgi:serine/threonine protein phosphatase PrpC